jgi:activating signal cointegrator complex subunit 1
MSLTEPDKLDTAISMLRGMDIRDVLETSIAASSMARESSASSDTTNGSKVEASQPQEATQPIKVQLRGLMSMQDATATTVLYAAPDDNSGRLLRFCEAVRARFTEERLLVPDKRELKLHATIMNTIYAKGQRRGKNGRKEPLKIDARELIERWKDHAWAEVTLDKVVICEMGAKEDEEGVLRYHEIAEAPLV